LGDNIESVRNALKYLEKVEARDWVTAKKLDDAEVSLRIPMTVEESGLNHLDRISNKKNK
jgi:hypothetical protein